MKKNYNNGDLVRIKDPENIFYNASFLNKIGIVVALDSDSSYWHPNYSPAYVVFVENKKEFFSFVDIVEI